MLMAIEGNTITDADPAPGGAYAADDDDLRWYVVRCYSGAEWQTRKALLKRGIEAFYPWTIAEVRRNHYFQPEIRALFKGYIFAGLELGQEFQDVTAVPSAISILKVGDRAVLVSEEQMRKLRLQAAEEQMVGWGAKARVIRVNVGDWVAVPEGYPFAGIPVEITAIDKQRKVRASLGTLGNVEFPLAALAEESRAPSKAMSKA